MNVTLVVSTPEHPEPFTQTFDHVESVRWISDSTMLDMDPGLQVRLPGAVHRFSLDVVLDLLVTS
jgi:hypothetical protein